MADSIALTGPIESRDGKLVLLIPLESGGIELAEVARGICEIDGDFLKVTIPPWLATKLGIREGSTVEVNNADGKFNIYPEIGTKDGLTS